MRASGAALLCREVSRLIGHDLALLQGVGVLKAVSETVKIALARFFGGFGLTAFLALVFPFGATHFS